jgi:hypothetical protein
MPYFIKSAHYGSIASNGFTILARIYLNTMTHDYGIPATNNPMGPKARYTIDNVNIPAILDQVEYGYKNISTINDRLSLDLF